MSLITPDKHAVSLVEFKYGDPDDPVYARYTDDVKDTPAVNAVFSSAPEMDVKLPPSNGVFKEKELLVTLKTDDFAEMISSGEPVSQVWVRVWEMVTGETTRLVWRGKATRAVRNYQGKRNHTLVEAFNTKSSLDVALGVMATHTCHHIFTKRGCRVVAPPEIGSIATVVDNVITIGGLAAHVNKYWHRGYIWREGIQVGIREWISGTSFTLSRRPPSSWVNEQVTVYPGCDRTIEICRTVWNNEQNFGGIGYAMVNRNPLYEV